MLFFSERFYDTILQNTIEESFLVILFSNA